MRLAFMGTPPFAVPTLDALVDAGHDVVCVIARPDKPVGRGQKMQSPATVLRARELGIETRQPRGIRSGPFPERFRDLGLDVAVVVAYGRILTPYLLASTRLGCINGHASLLPRWRGAAPIERAIAAGDSVTGVTTMQMDVGLDTGDMLLSREVSIGESDTAPMLRERLARVTAELLVKTLDGFTGLSPRPQPAEGATHAAPLEKAQGRLDWELPASVNHDHIRAFQPWPGTFCAFRGDNLKIHSARLVSGEGGPGEVLSVKGSLVVACGQGAIEVLEAQLPGKKSLPGPVLANGARIRVGEVLS